MSFFGKTKIPTTNSATIVLCLAVAVIGASIFKDVVLAATGDDREITFLVELFTKRPHTDSWGAIDLAVNIFRSTPDADIYQTIHFDKRMKFQYPPTSLLPFLPLNMLGVSSERLYALMHIVLLASLFAMIAVTAKLALDHRHMPSLAPVMARPSARWMLVAGVAVGTLTFYPIMHGYVLGQIQILIDLQVCMALLAWMYGRRSASGALMALAALVKPQFALVLIWSLVRRQHRFAIGFAAVAIPAGLASLLVFGFSEHLNYLSFLSYMGRHGEVYWANQSMNGLLNRLILPFDQMKFTLHSFAPFHPVVYAGTVVTSLALVVLALGYRPHWTRRACFDAPTLATRQESLLDLSTVLVALTLASPIAWGHHYGVTWPIYVIMLMTLADLYSRRQDRLVAILLVGLGVSYLLVSNYLTMLYPFRASPLNLLQSYQYFGGLGLLLVLLGLRGALGPTNSSETSPTLAPASQSAADHQVATRKIVQRPHAMPTAWTTTNNGSAYR